MPSFVYQDPFPILNPEEVTYRLVTRDHVSVGDFEGTPMLRVDPEGLRVIAREALRDVSFLLRTKHLEQVAAILGDPESSPADRGVAATMLRNAEVSAKFRLPFCQDTGTATIIGKKGQQVFTGVIDEAYLSQGVFDTYTTENLRYSQNAPLSLYDEVNTNTNLPAQIDLYATKGMEYNFLFIAKGGGSANKTSLFQETRAVLSPGTIERYLTNAMKSLGTAACPPYHIAFAIGGTSAESTLKTVKLASTGYLDGLPTSGNEHGQAFRDIELESALLVAAQKLGFGAQFGGKHFALDVRVVRLPRHGASCPIGIGVSCSAHRNILGKIDQDGIWVEQLDTDPGRFIPKMYRSPETRGVVRFDLRRPMKDILAELSQHPVRTRLSLSGTIIVARDIAHAKLKERVDSGEGLPQYFKDHPVYYAGPAKTPPGMPSGSFGPTTAGRMDS
ncbi:MAG: fumarate hydratase, partial [Polyangiaceae bacterium]|nr:fumarate hydratase [Polyangiaceae bacterium]